MINDLNLTPERIQMNHILARTFDPQLRKLVNETMAYAKANNIPESSITGFVITSLFRMVAVEFIESHKRQNAELPDPYQCMYWITQQIQKEFLDMYHDLYLDDNRTPDA